jgi:hypothetical protein
MGNTTKQTELQKHITYKSGDEVSNLLDLAYQYTSYSKNQKKSKMALSIGKKEEGENSQTFTHLTGSEMVKTIDIQLPSSMSACVYNIRVISMTGEVLMHHIFYGNSTPIKIKQSKTK